jgi:hypothetical protein
MAAIVPSAETNDATSTKHTAGVKGLFGVGLHGWEQLMLWSLGFAALAAVAVVVTTTVVVTLQKSENEESRAELEKFKLEASERIASANAAGDIAKAEAAKANLALEKLRAPREISDAQIAKMVLKLVGFAGQEWSVTTYWDLKEPLALSNRIKRALDSSGWKYTKTGSESFLMGVTVGVEVYSHPEAQQSTKDAARGLVAALNDADIAAVFKQQNSPHNNEIQLIVGIKQ